VKPSAATISAKLSGLFLRVARRVVAGNRNDANTIAVVATETRELRPCSAACTDSAASLFPTRFGKHDLVIVPAGRGRAERPTASRIKANAHARFRTSGREAGRHPVPRSS
jgi:hypothetical protein